MENDLRPLSIGDVFDTAFDLYKRNFALFAGVTALVQVPAQIVFGAVTLWLGFDRFGEEARTPAEVGAMFAAFGLLMAAVVVYHFLYLAQSGALSIAVAERLLGRPVTIGESYRRLRPALGRLVGAWVLIDLLLTASTFVLFVASSLFAVFIAGAAAMAAGSSGEPGVVIMVVIMILMVGVPVLGFLGLLTAFGVFTTQAVVIEGSGATAALSRNWALLRGRFWPPFWCAVALAVIVSALHLALLGSIELILGLALYSWLPLSHVAETVVRQSISAAISLFIQPFVMVSLTVLYVDQRIRKEGFDIELALHDREARAMAKAAVEAAG
jgi:hypothetical protein